MCEQGQIIWAKTNKKLWPAITLLPNDVSAPIRRDYIWVFWFGDYRVSEVRKSVILDFEHFFKRNKTGIFNDNGGQRWSRGVYEAIKAYGYPDTNAWNNVKLRNWAETGFEGRRNIERSLPEFVVDKLHSIHTKENSPLKSVKNYAELRKLRVNIESICIGCYSTNIIDKHPIFRGHVCRRCKDKLISSIFHIGNDHIHYCCFICGSFGEMLVCSHGNCGRSYCYRCLENLTEIKAKKLVSKKHWNCFFCRDVSTVNKKILQLREDWRDQLNRELINDVHPIPQIFVTKRKLRVLSLFDGIASGYTALKRINVSVEVYFACEIDDEAMKITSENYGNNIIQLGDVADLKDDVLAKICPIDLLMGGSPCNELSLANPDRKGVEDPTGSGILFFYFHKILMSLKRLNKGPFFWLFENVASMTTDSKEIISRFLQMEPIKFDASWVSPQIRERFYWGNCPSLRCNFEEEGPELQEYLEDSREALFKKIDTVTTRSNSLLQGNKQEYPVKDVNGKFDTLTINELENVFGFEKDYTSGAHTVTARQILVGKAWSVQVTCMLLHFLKFYFEENDVRNS